MSNPRYVLPLVMCSVWSALEAEAAPAQLQDDQAYAVAQLGEAPRLLELRAPAVSQEHVERGEPLKGLFGLVVSPEGGVVDAYSISSGDASFSEACLTAIRSWRFEPGQLNGRNAFCRMRVPMMWKP